LNLDDLAPIVAASGRGRRAELRRADTIVRDEAKRSEAWRRARAAAPAIIALHSDAGQARRSVLQRHALELAQLPPPERGLVETITSQLVAKLLHAPTLELGRQAFEQAG
jgi:glutamyl-tRNA reductase